MVGAGGWEKGGVGSCCSMVQWPEHAPHNTAGTLTSLHGNLEVVPVGGDEVMNGSVPVTGGPELSHSFHHVRTEIGSL